MNPERITVSGSMTANMSDRYAHDFAIMEWKNGLPRKLEKQKERLVCSLDFFLLVHQAKLNSEP